MSKKTDINNLYDLEDDDLSKLSNNKIIEIMGNLNNEQLKKIGKMSIYDGFYGSLECMEMVRKFKFMERIGDNEEKKELENYYNKLLSLIYNLDKKAIKEEKELDTVKDIRKSLYKFSNSFKPYVIEISYINELASHYLNKNMVGIQEELRKVDQESLNKLYLDVTNYLAKDSKDYYLFSQKVSTIIRLLPFRMTKEKFLNLIESSLRRNLVNYPKEYVDSQIRDYKRLFDGSMEPSYGTRFDNYFRRTQNLKQAKFKDLSLEENEKVLEDSQSLLKEVEQIDFFMRNLGILTNKLIVVSLTSSLNTDSMLDKEIVKEWKELNDSFNEDRIEKLKEKLKKEISLLEKDLFKANNFLEKISNEVIKRPDIIDEKLNEELLFTKQVLAFYNDVIFEDEKILLLKNEDFINSLDKDYLEEVLSNFIQYINRSISLMSNVERKLRMKRLLSIIEFPFERPEDFMDYMEASLDQRVTNNDEIFISINSLYYLMDMEIK